MIFLTLCNGEVGILRCPFGIFLAFDIYKVTFFNFRRLRPLVSPVHNYTAGTAGPTRGAAWFNSFQ